MSQSWPHGSVNFHVDLWKWGGEGFRYCDSRQYFTGGIRVVFQLGYCL